MGLSSLWFLTKLKSNFRWKSKHKISLAYEIVTKVAFSFLNIFFCKPSAICGISAGFSDTIRQTKSVYMAINDDFKQAFFQPLQSFLEKCSLRSRLRQDLKPDRSRLETLITNTRDLRNLCVRLTLYMKIYHMAQMDSKCKKIDFFRDVS